MTKKTKLSHHLLFTLLLAGLMLPATALASPNGNGTPAQVQAALLAAGPSGFGGGSKLSSGYRCSPLLHLRSPERVMRDHHAALMAGDIDRAMCDYAPNATVLTEDGANVGRDAIRAGFEAMAGLFGSLPTVTGTHTAGPTVMVTWEISTPFASIPDGVDTFVILFGQIHYQTVHARIHFH